MKNFYDLPDTETISVRLLLSPVANAPLVTTVNINGNIIHNGIISEKLSLVTRITVNEKLHVHVRVSGAIRCTDVIDEIFADDFAIIPHYAHLSTCTATTLETSWEFNSKCALLWWVHEISGQGWLLKP